MIHSRDCVAITFMMKAGESLRFSFAEKECYFSIQNSDMGELTNGYFSVADGYSDVNINSKLYN